MNRATKKTINYLSQWLGKEIIRTKPTYTNDWSYTTTPILLVGFTPDGCIRYQRTSRDKDFHESEEDVLYFSFTDRNWITLKKAMKPKNNRLNQWKGKKIKKFRTNTKWKSTSFMSGNFPTLIAASKHHLIVMDAGKRYILNDASANAEDWALAE